MAPPPRESSPGLSIAIRIPLRLAGFVLLAIVAIALVSLASWSVDDPSLSYATAKIPQNWLGFPGAVVADLMFQVFGLASLVLLLPLALWGWAMARRQRIVSFGLRAGAWVLSSVLACGVFAFVPMPETWPLPTGLGGLVGTGFTNLAAVVAGADPQPITAALFAIIIAAPALAAYWIALGLGKTEPAAGTAGAERNRAAAREEDGEGERESNPIFDIAIGALVHMGYSARTAFRRARARQEERRATGQQFDDHTAEPGFESRSAPAEPRREPQFGGERRIAAPSVASPEPGAHRHAGGYEDEAVIDYPDEPDYDDVPFDIDPAPPAATRSSAARREPAAIADTRQGDSRFVSARVAAPAQRPAPGARVMREAQGSLLLEDGGGFELPPLSLLAEPRHTGVPEEHRPEHLEALARQLEGVLEDFGVKGDIINVRPGPVVTLFELEPAPGIKSSRVISLADDIARSMSAISARVAVVPGRNAIGIELPNKTRETVYLREMLGSSDFEKMKGKLPICLGKTIGGEPVIADLARMPHLLIAGTTGSGKSVGINTMILSLLYQMTPEQCRLIMIDPKMLELSIYDGIPHLLTPVVTDPQKAVVALKWAVREMEDRYRKMSKIGVRNIDGFNQRVSEARKKGEVLTRTVQTGFDRETGEPIFESEEFDLEPLPYIVIIVDEMADLMMVAGKDIEGAIQRLAQMARAAGIHMVTATQRPSVDVITGTIKANFPTRISFMVTSKIDSRTILGEQGAEQLLGNGDMLYMAGGGRIKRLHGPFVADGEVEAIVSHLKSQGTPEYLDSITEDEDGEITPEMTGDDYAGSGDELYDKAVHIVLTDKKASTSYIQRRLAIGYNKAATLIERMEQEGVISSPNHAGKREILVGADQY
ncbi:cell division protein FtsK [Devosia geojensis]|uniref:DNA translocase FtsK n=1 Tax=Devosia geojensis TaxID=443610 RepID=A0A0F5FDB3_9HYPH|nr:DNA translocase FtsK 4TM domain-containing protein [Devosia geojensis]KKB06914.1 cell division protein FtsK [Devosia geojensis]